MERSARSRLAAMTTTALDVITLGETMVSFAAHEAGALDAATTFTKIVAGAETNVGVGLARRLRR